MKTKEELAALKKEVEAVKEKLAELNDEEMEQVTGGAMAQDFCLITAEPQHLEKTCDIKLDNEPIDRIRPGDATAVIGTGGGAGGEGAGGKGTAM